MTTTFLAELGEAQQALTEAGPVADRMEAAGDIAFTEPRSLQLRLLAERGTHARAPAADEFLGKARASGETQASAIAFAAAARLALAQTRRQEARALLVELEQIAGIRVDPYYAPVLPELVRTALALGEAELAALFVDGVEATTPLFANALAACRAQLAEAAGERAEAAGLHADAAERWREFGNVPERAYALLGQGRCLVAVGKPAEVPLGEARELFASMGYKAALAETEALLGEDEVAAV